MNEVSKTSSELMVLTDIGLDFNGDVSWEALEETGKGFKKYIRFYQKNLRWAVGDFIIYAKRRFPEKYTQLLEAEMYTDGTLLNCEYVCSKIPKELRNPNLSFEHHYQVARLQKEDISRLLADAEKNDWSIRQLRTAACGEYPVNEQLFPNKLTEGRLMIFSEWMAENEKVLLRMCRKEPIEALKSAWFAGQKNIAKRVI